MSYVTKIILKRLRNHKEIFHWMLYFNIFLEKKHEIEFLFQNIFKQYMIWCWHIIQIP